MRIKYKFTEKKQARLACFEVKSTFPNLLPKWNNYSARLRVCSRVSEAELLHVLKNTANMLMFNRYNVYNIQHHSLAC